MWQDLAALTPPLVVCVAFIIGVVIFLRRQMAPKRRADSEPPAADRAGRGLDISGNGGFMPNWPNCRTAGSAASSPGG